MINFIRHVFLYLFPQPPALDALDRISERAWLENEYDCSEKAADYWRACHRANYQGAEVLVVRRREGGLHAVVRVCDRLRRVDLIVDPSQGRWWRSMPFGWEIERAVGMAELLHPGSEEWT